MELAKYLSHSENSANRDVATFNNWKNGFITTEEAINEFKINNNIDSKVRISPAEFTMWLYSLGYGR